MMVGTLLAILNAISLIFKDVVLVSWGWVILAYVLEIICYLFILFCCFLIIEVGLR